MRTYSEADIRDVALIGHGGAGKTSLGEAILYDTKSVTRLGRVDEESSNLDTEPEEKKRKGTINPHVAVVEWRKSKINLIDTSGQGDFLTDSLLALSVADSAVVVVGAADGVQVYTEKTWQESERLGLPRLIFVNKMDRERADFDQALEQIQRLLSEKAVPVTLPTPDLPTRGKRLIPGDGLPDGRGYGIRLSLADVKGITPDLGFHPAMGELAKLFG